MSVGFGYISRDVPGHSVSPYPDSKRPNPRGRTLASTSCGVQTWSLPVSSSPEPWDWASPQARGALCTPALPMAGLLAAAGQRFPSASRTTAIHSLKSAGRRCFITKPLGRPLEGLRTWSLSTLLQIRKRNRHLFDRVAAPGKGEAASQGEPHVPVLIEQVLESFRDTKLGVSALGFASVNGNPGRPQDPAFH